MLVLYRARHAHPEATSGRVRELCIVCFGLSPDRQFSGSNQLSGVLEDDFFLPDSV